MPQPTYVLIALLGFGFIVFIHELGHFLAAKLFRVKVRAFSLGFPPTILHKRLGETDYRLGLVPFGGYVSMVGENPEDETQDDPRALSNIDPWKRAVIFMAGVFMNILSAMVIFIAASVVGIEVVPATVGGVADPSPAKVAGLKPGDRILAIDGNKVDAFEEIRLEVVIGAVNDPDHKFRLSLQGRQEPIEVGTFTDESGLPALGVESPLLPVVKKVRPGSPADLLALEPDDRITAVNDQPIEFANQLIEMLEDEPKKPFSLTVERAGREVRLEVDPAKLKVPDYGISPVARVEGLLVGAPAEKAGLKVGDVIAQVGDRKHPRVGEIGGLVQSTDGAPLVFKVWREGQYVELPVTPELKKDLGYYHIGLTSGEGQDPPTLMALDRPSAAREAGIPDGAVITGVGGKNLKKWETLAELLDELKGDAAQITFRPPGEEQEKTVTVTPRMEPPEMPLDGITLVGNLKTNLDPIYNPLKALDFGYRKLRRFVRLQGATIMGLATKRVQTKELTGPLRIGVGFYRTAESGASTFVMFLGFISIAIATVNAMPLPPLDGGLVVFVLVEKLIGRPVSLKIRQGATIAGLVLLLGVVVLAFFNDITWMVREFG